MKIPRVLLVGDSVRMHYTPLVQKFLRGKAEILVIEENCQDSEKVKNNIQRWITKFGEETIDIIHFNCGLHDIKHPFDAEGNQVSLEDYKQNLKKIVQILKDIPHVKLIWASTTPVITELHHKNKPFDRFLKDVIAYNFEAYEIMKSEAIPVNNLFAVLNGSKIYKYIKKDGVHCKKRGNKLLAAKVAAAIENML